MKKKSKKIERWLDGKCLELASEADMVTMFAEEYFDARERYKKTGSLPRDVRREYNLTHPAA